MTADTPTRQIGDVSVEAARRFLTGSPLESDAAEIVAACPGWGAMALAFAKKESSLGAGQSARETNNPLGLMRRPGDTRRCLQLAGGCLLRFGRWADAFAEYGARMATAPYDPTKSLTHNVLVYVGGPRCPDILAADPRGVCANGHRWDAGDPDTDLSVYVAQTVERINAVKAFDAAPGPKPQPVPDPTPPPDPWRPYPYPKMVDLVVEKPGEGAGFTRGAFRRPLIRGFCTHITDGPPSQSIEFFAEFFGTGGARAWDALTDLVIGWDGRIGLLNDWRDPKRGGTRAGWANGGVDGLEGEGVAFYRRFPDINVHLVSCEHCQKAGGEWSDAMLAATIEIRTAIAQELRCPAADYPFHPAYGGASIEQQHRNFATKSCPASPYISTYDAVVRREVRAKLRAWQGGEVEPPAPEPVKRYTDWGLTLGQVADYFGVLRRVNEDGSVDDLPFDPTGPVSLAWLRRAEERGVFPEAEEMRLWDATVGKGRAWFATFEGGDVLFKPAGDTRAGWVWLDSVGGTP